MIFGIGTDIVQVDRMQKLLDEHGSRFAHRVLAEWEWADFEDTAKPAHFLAKRFAAKEATAKALGTGFRYGMSLKHIGVKHTDEGKPVLSLEAKAAELAATRNISAMHISIADEIDYAVAYVILTSESDPSPNV